MGKNYFIDDLRDVVLIVKFFLCIIVVVKMDIFKILNIEIIFPRILKDSDLSLVIDGNY